MSSESQQKIEQDNKFLKVDRIIEEFKDKISQLKATIELNQYDFIQELKIKLDKVCKKLRKKMMGVIAKYYFKYSKGGEFGNAVKMVKFNINTRNSIVDLKAYQEYIRYQNILRKRKNKLNELKNMISNNFGSFRKRITHEKLFELKDKYPENFDFVEPNEDPEDRLTSIHYGFNFYTKEHYKIIPNIINKWFLDNCTQLTIGSCIHDNKLYKYLMNDLFPPKVKDLKVVHYEYLGRCDKIWYDQLFKNNAGKVVNEVRLCRLKLDADDIAQIMELFNHVKSIWFLNCHLQIDDPICFKDVYPDPDKDYYELPSIYYQIEKISFIDCYRSCDEDDDNKSLI